MNDLLEQSKFTQRFVLPCKVCGEPQERCSTNKNVTCFKCKTERWRVAYLENPKKIVKAKKRTKKVKIKPKELLTPFDIWGKKKG